jgi:hypothetical protein
MMVPESGLQFSSKVAIFDAGGVTILRVIKSFPKRLKAAT